MVKFIRSLLIQIFIRLFGAIWFGLFSIPLPLYVSHFIYISPPNDPLSGDTYLNIALITMSAILGFIFGPLITKLPNLKKALLYGLFGGVILFFTLNASEAVIDSITVCLQDINSIYCNSYNPWTLFFGFLLEFYWMLFSLPAVAAVFLPISLIATASFYLVTRRCVCYVN